MSVLQDLYDSEINASISSFWDAGWTVRIGDEMNGFRAETSVQRIGEADAWLIDQAIRLYPKSEFARIYRDGLSPHQARQEHMIRSREYPASTHL